MKVLFRTKNAKVYLFTGFMFGVGYDKDYRYHSLVIFLGFIYIEFEIPKKH
jgi:hypothetical protein